MSFSLKRAAVTIAIFFTLLAVVVAVFVLPPKIDLQESTVESISGVAVYNPGGELRLNQTIEIADGLITNIRDAQENDPDPICVNCFAMPGLIDAHIHTPPRIAIGNQQLFSLLYLRYGVTSVRDLGQSDESVASLAAKIEQGKIYGPRMYRCGPVLDGDPPGWPNAQLVRNADEAAATVRRLKKEGVDCIKVYNEITKEVFAAIRAQAAVIELPVIGHIPHALGMEGVREFESQHLTGVPYVAAPRPDVGTDFTSEDIVNLSTGDLDLAVKIAKHNRISFTPTLANHWQRLTASDLTRFPPTEGADYMPAFWDSAWQTVAGHPDSAEEIQTHVEATQKLRDFVRKAHKQGIDILAGTDTLMPWLVPGESLHSEIAIFAELFESNDLALQAATLVNGRHIDESKIGELKPGAYADILLLPMDPRISLANVRRWEYVILGGQLISRKDLNAALQRFDDHFNSTAYTNIMGLAVGDAADEYTSK